MNRSSFLKALLALPFGGKALAEIESGERKGSPCPFCQDTGFRLVPEHEFSVACWDCAPTVDEIPQISRHYSITTMKEIDEIWRECFRKVLAGTKVLWE